MLICLLKRCCMHIISNVSILWNDSSIFISNVHWDVSIILNHAIIWSRFLINKLKTEDETNNPSFVIRISYYFYLLSYIAWCAQIGWIQTNHYDYYFDKIMVNIYRCFVTIRILNNKKDIFFLLKNKPTILRIFFSIFTISSPC